MNYTERVSVIFKQDESTHGNTPWLKEKAMISNNLAFIFPRSMFKAEKGVKNMNRFT